MDDPGTAWSRWWKCGIEGWLQVPEIPSPDRIAISIGELENAAKKGPVRANTVRLLDDHGTKESRVPGSNDFKQPNDWWKARLIIATPRGRRDQSAGCLQERAKTLSFMPLGR